MCGVWGMEGVRCLCVKRWRDCLRFLVFVGCDVWESEKVSRSDFVVGGCGGGELGIVCFWGGFICVFWVCCCF